MYTTITPNDAPIRKVLLKGGPGTGKTVKAVQFPKPVLFSFDNNLASISLLDKDIVSNLRIVNPYLDLAGKEIPKTKIWDNFVVLLEKVLADATVRTIILDSLTTFSSRLMDKVLGTDSPTKAPQIQDWGTYHRYMKWLGDELLSNPALDKNVVVIAHELRQEEENKVDNTKSITYTLNMGGSIKDSFDLYFTDCWRTYVRQGISGPPEFRVRTQPTNQFNAKTTLVGVPNDFIWDTEKTKILAQIK